MDAISTTSCAWRWFGTRTFRASYGLAWSKWPIRYIKFVLDRLTGIPVFPVEERPVPASSLRTERASPTHPFNSQSAAARTGERVITSWRSLCRGGLDGPMGENLDPDSK